METKLATIQPEDLQIVPTKSQVESAVDSIYTLVEGGRIDALQALATLSAFEKAFGEAKKAIMDMAVKEAETYPAKTIELYGASFQLKETGVKFDYSDDDEWKKLKADVDAKNAELKGREATLKSLGQYHKFGLPSVSVTLGK